MKEVKGIRVCGLALAFAVTACGGGGKAADAGPVLTPQEQVARLEASGVLPTLERGDSIAGIDANANGVRDDIEQHIEKKYTVVAERAAAMQTARAYQRMLLVDKSDAVALDAASEAGSLAIVCARSAFVAVDGLLDRSRMSAELESMTTNTKARLLAYLEYNKARSGTVSTMPKGGSCE
ncbi:MAG: hypothetical protein QUV35_06010 [Hydrogenophaga sp.]|uniref:hypothetical protein n=1 Tax=Hydrogenophaga sp. TaxID=1904254 RepID=UPI00260C37BC|nr:hypothetical protein [Hydrogenophaga sp.]MDM7942165.1 hypothetical protein [Hydrogenophaga sp.]